MIKNMDMIKFYLIWSKLNTQEDILKGEYNVFKATKW
jgi:hypothetical protein